MYFESLIRRRNEAAIETPLAHSGFVPACQQYGVPPGVESERQTPRPASRTEPKLFHVGVLGSFECIDVRPTDVGTQLRDYQAVSADLILDYRR